LDSLFSISGLGERKI